MSLQKSKGLTSKVAIVAGCIQGLIPFQDFKKPHAEQQAILAEQRRLFYVAITRCTEILVLSSARMLERKLAFKLGARVSGGHGAVGTTVSSQFFGELGPKPPSRKSVRLGLREIMDFNPTCRCNLPEGHLVSLFTMPDSAIIFQSPRMNCKASPPLKSGLVFSATSTRKCALPQIRAWFGFVPCLRMLEQRSRNFAGFRGIICKWTFLKC